MSCNNAVQMHPFRSPAGVNGVQYTNTCNIYYHNVFNLCGGVFLIFFFKTVLSMGFGEEFVLQQKASVLDLCNPALTKAEYWSTLVCSFKNATDGKLVF